MQSNRISLALNWPLLVLDQIGKCWPSDKGLLESGSAQNMEESPVQFGVLPVLEAVVKCVSPPSTVHTTVITKPSRLSRGRRVLQTQCPQTLVLQAGSMENSRTGFDWLLPVTSELASKLHVSHKVLKTAVPKWVPGCPWPTWR